MAKRASGYPGATLAYMARVRSMLHLPGPVQHKQHTKMHHAPLDKASSLISISIVTCNICSSTTMHSCCSVYHILNAVQLLAQTDEIASPESKTAKMSEGRRHLGMPSLSDSPPGCTPLWLVNISLLFRLWCLNPGILNANRVISKIAGNQETHLAATFSKIGAENE